MSPPGSGGEHNHQLPDGSWVCLRIQNDPWQSRWTLFWVTFVTGEVRPTSYRVFPAGTEPPEWKLMKPAAMVDKQTGIEDDESDKDAEETMRENEGKIGAARRLRPGKYVLQSKIRVGTDDVELTSVEFEVSLGPYGAGWG